MNFKPIQCLEQERGKHIKGSKRRYLWIFEVNGEKHELQLFCSFISSKRKVVLDGIILCKNKNLTFDFHWTHKFHEITLQIKQDITQFPLYIDGINFIGILQQNAWGMRQQSVFDRYELHSKPIFQMNQLKFFNGIGTEKQLSNIEMSDIYNHGEAKQNQIFQEQSLDPSQITIQFPRFNYYPQAESKNQQEENIDLLIEDEGQEQLEPCLLYPQAIRYKQKIVSRF